MTTTKFVKSSAPYNHDTFNSVSQYLVGMSGVLQGGLTTTSGTTVTVQPLSWIQNGLIVNVDIPLTATLPVYLTPPYYVAVTSSSPIEMLTEIITPTFVKRPEDISAGTVLVAAWDGTEWRQLPYLDISAQIAARAQDAINENFIGIGSGFSSAVNGSNIVVAPGAAIAVDGTSVVKKVSTSLPIIAADPDGYERIDEVVLRKPQGDPSRIATINYVVGQICDPSGGTDLSHATSISSSVSSAAKILNNPTTDDLYFLYLEGTTLNFRQSNNVLGSMSGATVLSATVDAFDAVLNPSGSIDIVYTDSTDVHYLRIDNTGSVIFTDSVIYTNVNPVSNARLVTIASGSTYYIHIVFQQYVGPTQNMFKYLRLSALNTVETNAVTLLNTGDQIANPSLEKDDDDSILFLAFEDTTNGAVYLVEYDAGTATNATPPTVLVPMMSLQSDTFNLITQAALASTGAKNAVVKRAANKETYVFWLHTTGGGNYVVAVYNRNYINTFGHKALYTTLYTLGESTQAYDVAIDGLSTAHIIMLDADEAVAANLQLDTFTASAPIQIEASGCMDVRTAFTSLGALIHAYADSTPSSNLVKSTSGLITTLRDRQLPFTDVYLAHYRKSDGQISVAGTAIEEDPSIRRLYEFNHLYAGTGSVTWTGSATNKIVINAPITINGLNRSGTLTIPTNGAGTVVPVGYAACIAVPDDDVTQNVSLQMIAFGSGLLDRYHRNLVPIFWNISSVLYTRFAPFRLDAAGETVIIGHTLNDDERSYLGMPVDPDPSNHGYTSTVHITQSMSHNEAIGVLDAAITGGGGGDTFTTGNVALTNGTTTQAVTFSTAFGTTNYRVVPSFENDTDPNPQFQPITITNKLTTGFTATWNAPLDSGNYSLNYLALIDSNDAGSQALTIGTQTQTITFGTARGTPLYKPIVIMENTVDPNPQYQPITITNKTVNGFTVKWNAPLDSSNYTLDWIVAD